ncbi:hypothetical protein ABTY00_27440 [Streptomyces microflavus]|uniref:hypothetical protein n=1 Tax=Streptomyces microflavus TaxID=1919 RepID=UPI003322D33E
MTDLKPDEQPEPTEPTAEEIEALKAAGLYDPATDALMGEISVSADAPINHQQFIDALNSGKPVTDPLH